MTDDPRDPRREERSFLERASVEGYPPLDDASGAAIACALDAVTVAYNEITEALLASTDPSARYVRQVLGAALEAHDVLRKTLSHALQVDALAEGPSPLFPPELLRAYRLFPPGLIPELGEEDLADLAPSDRIVAEAARDWLVRRGALDG